MHQLPTARKLNRFLRIFSLPTYKIRRDLSCFSEFLPHVRMIIDVGSGKDFVYRHLFKTDVYIGLDRYEFSHVAGDVGMLPFASPVADVIICTEVLEHVPDPGLGLSETHRVLKKGGFLIVTVPLLWGEHDRTDFHRWTEAGLRKLLAEAGFSVVALKRRGGIFSVMGCFMAQIPQQIFGSLGQQKSWFTKLPYILTLVPAMAMPWLMLPLDLLDRNRNFVIGYSVLCKKS